jgi:hypothetical protein
MNERNYAVTTVHDTTVGRFEPGELVNIRIDRARFIGEDNGHREFSVPNPGGDAYALYLARGVNVTVERVAPKEWPPQPGDVWADGQGNRLFATQVPGRPLVLVVADGARNEAECMLDAWGPLHLVARDGWAPDALATVDEPEAVDERARYVAALRALADFVESRTDLPVPNDTPTAQVSWSRSDGPEVRVPEVALLLGVEVERDDRERSTVLTATYEDPAGFAFVAYGRKPTDPPPAEVAETASAS